MTDDEIRRRFEAPVREAEAQAIAKSVATLTRALEAAAPIAGDGSCVETVDALDGAVLERLFGHRVAALRVPNFYPRASATALAEWVAAQRFEAWDGTDMFFGVGRPANATQSSVEECVAYFAEAVPTMHRIRRAARGLAPMDRLRLELDEVWPAGANASTRNPYGRKMLVGIGRMMTPEGLQPGIARTEGLVHVDASPYLDPAAGGFSANVYLEVPRGGGELCVWGVTLTDPSDRSQAAIAALLADPFDTPRMDAVQRKLREVMPPPHVIAVEPGDLVILASGRPHAVRGFSDGRRVSFQTFVNHREGEPLALHS